MYFVFTQNNTDIDVEKCISLDIAKQRMHTKCSIARKKLEKYQIAYKEAVEEKRITLNGEGFRFTCWIKQYEDTDYDNGFMKGYEFAVKRLDSYSNTILSPSKTSLDNEPLRRELTRRLISRLKMMYQNDHNKLEEFFKSNHS